MNKLVFALTGILLFTGCDIKSEKKGNHSAIGEIADVMIFSDQKTLAECDQLVDSVWGRPMVTMDYEPTFNVRTSPIKDFDGYAKRNYNLFVLVHKDNWQKMKHKMKSEVVSAVEQAFNDNNRNFALKDVFVHPQIVYFILAEDLEDLKKELDEKKQELLAEAISIERKTTIESLIRTKIQYDSFYHDLMAKEGYAFRKPEIFNHTVTNENFYGVSHYVADKHAGVYAYSEPYTDRKQFGRAHILGLRDSMLKLYIKGPVRPDNVDTYMQTSYDGMVPIETRVTSLNGHYAVETRGWWDMENDYMGGPFISYTIHSEKLNRVVTLEANVFAPGRSKRKLMRECELIISTFTD